MAFAMDLRRAWLRHARGDSGLARRDLRALAASTEDGDSRLMTALMLARIARDLGEPQDLAALIADIARQPASSTPILLFEPPIETTEARASRDETIGFAAPMPSKPRSTDYESLRWADIGFWLRPDGRVADVEVLRGSRTTGWAVPVVKAIAGRRYAPVEAEVGAPGQYRLERYTYAADIIPVSGSFIKRRAGPGRLRRQDITLSPPTVTAQRE